MSATPQQRAGESLLEELGVLAYGWALPREGQRCPKWRFVGWLGVCPTALLIPSSGNLTG